MISKDAPKNGSVAADIVLFRCCVGTPGAGVRGVAAISRPRGRERAGSILQRRAKQAVPRGVGKPHFMPLQLAC